MDNNLIIDEELVSLEIYDKSEIQRPTDGLTELILRKVPEEEPEQVIEEKPKHQNTIDEPSSDALDSVTKPEPERKPEFTEKPPEKKAMLQGRNEKIEITKDNFVIGKDRYCDYVLDQRYISREHCRITSYNSRYFIEDLDSTNGTKVDGKRIHSKTEIFKGQEITLADRRYEFWVD